MRIALVTDRYLPEARAAAYHSSELAQGWASLGHDVTVINRQPTQYVPGGPRSAAVPQRERLGGVDVRRFRGATSSLSIWSRFVDQLVLLTKLLAALIWGSRLDALYVLSPPLLFAAPVAVAARLRRTPMVLNLHDLYPQVAVDLGVLKNRFLIWAAERLEAFVYTPRRIS